MATLTVDGQKRIDSIIEDIKLRTGFSYPENSLLELARAENIRVFEIDTSVIGPNISGAIQYDDDEKKTNPVIYINKSDPDNRKIFTLAHELGHHFLHAGKKLRLDTLDYSRNDKDTIEESQANYFAASLLVPANLIGYRIERGDSIERLAEYFHVSIPVIKNRIKWLKAN